MANNNETDKFVNDEQPNISTTTSKGCCSKWWNQIYNHQQVICRIIRSYYFRALVIFLVIFDEGLLISEIILESYKVQSECEIYDHHFTKDNYEMIKERIELIMEIAHFSSIAILIFFTIELIFRVYASGKEFWNCRRKKMEYLDAFIVITSLIIDIYLLREKRILGKKLLIFALRLWRFVRIITSKLIVANFYLIRIKNNGLYYLGVAQGVHDDQIKHKRRLNTQYMIAIRRLIDLLAHKTNYVENYDEKLTSVMEYFRRIDIHCQSSYDLLEKNNVLTSSAIVAQFTEELKRLDRKSDNDFLSVIIAKSSEV